MSMASEHLSCAGWRDLGSMKTHEIHEYWGATKRRLIRNYLRDFLTRLSGCRDIPAEADDLSAQNPLTFLVSGCRDLNPGPPAPKAGALAKLRYIPIILPIIYETPGGEANPAP